MKFTKSSLPAWKRNEPLSKYSYIRMGGPADFFTVVKTADELAGAVIAAEEAGVPWFILGGGSNILVGDLGVRGLVIKNEAEGIWLDPRHNSYLIAESGVRMAKLAAFANRHGLGGLEMFMSVPGTLGGAIFNNSHYRPQKNEFIGNLVEEAEILEGRRKKEEGRRIVNKNWFRFGYDYSRLQGEKAVVLKVKFRLRQESPEILRERSLVLMKDRNSRQPIGSLSCGCMFKNPEGVSAGKLIDSAGLKGTKVGGVSVSTAHANFMVNDGGAKVSDVLKLMNRVKSRVKEIHGIELMPEIFFVGEFSHGEICD